MVKSPRARALLVTALMILALGLALLGAWLLTRARTIQWQEVNLGDIRLTIPQQWKAIRPEARSSSTLPLQSFLASQTPQHHLRIGRLRETAFRAPVVALREAVRDVAGQQAAAGINDAAVERRRSEDGDYVIVWTLAERLDEPMWLVIAVLTRDGRDYWAVDLTSPIGAGEDDAFAALSAYQLLFERVCRSARPRESPTETNRDWHADLIGAELVVEEQAWQRPDHFDIIHHHRRLPGGPIDLLPRFAQPYLAVMRVRGTLDADVDDPDHPLFPARLLERERLSLTGEPTPGQPIERVEVSGRSVWRMATESRLTARSPTNFVRIVAFVRLGAGRALLVESFCEPQIVSQHRAWLAAVIRGWPELTSRRAPFNIASEDSPAQEAIRRGRRLAATQRQTLLSLPESSVSYALIHDDSEPVAYAIDVIKSDSDDVEWPIRGRSLRSFPDGQSYLLDDRQWRLGPLGQRFVQQVNIQRRHVTLPVARHLQAYRQEIAGSQLRLIELRDPDRAAVRTMGLPQEHILPPATSQWDIALLRAWGRRQALAWLLVGEYPVACSVRWIEVKPSPIGEADSPSTPLAGSFLLIRPLVHPEPDVYRLGPTGVVIDRWDVRRPTGRRRHIQTVDRLALLAAFPDAAIPFAAP